MASCQKLEHDVGDGFKAEPEGWDLTFLEASLLYHKTLRSGLSHAQLSTFSLVVGTECQAHTVSQVAFCRRVEAKVI